MTKEQLCEELSLDYADRVAKAGMNYDDAYEHYFGRCMKREEKELLDQYNVQNLGTPSGFMISAELM